MALMNSVPPPVCLQVWARCPRPRSWLAVQWWPTRQHPCWGRAKTRATLAKCMGPAAIMCNLLPAAGNAGASAPSTSVYIREGLPPVPLKLAEKMHRWDYTDMSEILPEFWVPMGNLQHECNPLGQLRTPARCWRKVANIANWVQCFATYVGVLTGISLEAMLKLMGNLVQIVEVSQDFGSLAWVN